MQTNEIKKKYYQILDVDSDATLKEISDRYKSLVKKLHPDRNPNSLEILKEVNQAFSTLKDPTKRRVYDLFDVEGLHLGIDRVVPKECLNSFERFSFIPNSEHRKNNNESDSYSPSSKKIPWPFKFNMNQVESNDQMKNMFLTSIKQYFTQAPQAIKDELIQAIGIEKTSNHTAKKTMTSSDSNRMQSPSKPIQDSKSISISENSDLSQDSLINVVSKSSPSLSCCTFDSTAIQHGQAFNPTSSPPHNPKSFDSINSSFLENQIMMHLGQEFAQSSHNIIGKCNLDFAQCSKGCVVQLSLNRKTICKRCNGYGKETGDPIILPHNVSISSFENLDRVICPNCIGQGKVEIQQLVGKTYLKFRSTCKQCNGEKIVFATKGPKIDCIRCNGIGSFSKMNSINVNIQPNSFEGTIIQIPNQGHQYFKNGDRKQIFKGDACFVIFEKDLLFRRTAPESPHLSTKVYISFLDCISGCTLYISDPLDPNKETQVVLPAFMPQDKKICLVNHGLPWSGNHTSRRGDLNVILVILQPKIKIPDPVMTQVRNLLSPYFQNESIQHHHFERQDQKPPIYPNEEQNFM